MGGCCSSNADREVDKDAAAPKSNIPPSPKSESPGKRTSLNSGVDNSIKDREYMNSARPISVSNPVLGGNGSPDRRGSSNKLTGSNNPLMNNRLSAIGKRVSLTPTSSSGTSAESDATSENAASKSTTDDSLPPPPPVPTSPAPPLPASPPPPAHPVISSATELAAHAYRPQVNPLAAKRPIISQEVLSSEEASASSMAVDEEAEVDEAPVDPNAKGPRTPSSHHTPIDNQDSTSTRDAAAGDEEKAKEQEKEKEREREREREREMEKEKEREKEREREQQAKLEAEAKEKERKEREEREEKERIAREKQAEAERKEKEERERKEKEDNAKREEAERERAEREKADAAVPPEATPPSDSSDSVSPLLYLHIPPPDDHPTDVDASSASSDIDEMVVPASPHVVHQYARDDSFSFASPVSSGFRPLSTNFTPGAGSMSARRLSTGTPGLLQSKASQEESMRLKNAEYFKRMREEKEAEKKRREEEEGPDSAEKKKEISEKVQHDVSKTAHYKKLGSSFVDNRGVERLASPGGRGGIGGRGPGIGGGGRGN